MGKVIYLIVGLLVLSACSSGVDADKMAELEQMMVSKDYASVQEACDEIVAVDELKEIPIRDLCGLAVIYAKLSEHQSQEENMAKATKCYRTARSVNADSVASFMSELPMEDVQYGELLKNLAILMDSPLEIHDGEPCDGVEDAVNRQEGECGDEVKEEHLKDKVKKTAKDKREESKTKGK